MAAAGHDLRQRLQTLIVAIDLLPRRRSDDDPQCLAVIKEQARLMAGGLERLAHDANLCAYALPHSQTSFPLDLVLRRIDQRWRAMADARHLDFDIGRCPITVRSNADLLTTILDNLVGNAVKHTRDGSVRVRCLARDGSLLVSVQDSGPGLCKNDLASMFKPYWRGTQAGVGMGLGLAIVQQTAALLGHPINVTSCVGRGTCFTVHVPMGHRGKTAADAGEPALVDKRAANASAVASCPPGATEFWSGQEPAEPSTAPQDWH